MAARDYICELYLFVCVCVCVCYKQGVAFNVTHFKSRITHLLYTAINTTEHGQVSQCLGFTKSLTSSIQRLQYNVLEISSMTRQCCHHPCTLAMTLSKVSCVTFAVSWRITFLGLSMFLWGYLKAQVFTYTLPDINSLKNAIRQEIANVT